jgi:hypothetical protein
MKSESSLTLWSTEFLVCSETLDMQEKHHELQSCFKLGRWLKEPKLGLRLKEPKLFYEGQLSNKI